MTLTAPAPTATSLVEDIADKDIRALCRRAAEQGVRFERTGHGALAVRHKDTGEKMNRSISKSAKSSQKMVASVRVTLRQAGWNPKDRPPRAAVRGNGGEHVAILRRTVDDGEPEKQPHPESLPPSPPTAIADEAVVAGEEAMVEPFANMGPSERFAAALRARAPRQVDFQLLLTITGIKDSRNLSAAAQYAMKKNPQIKRVRKGVYVWDEQGTPAGAKAEPGPPPIAKLNPSTRGQVVNPPPPKATPVLTSLRVITFDKHGRAILKDQDGNVWLAAQVGEIVL